MVKDNPYISVTRARMRVTGICRGTFTILHPITRHSGLHSPEV